MQNVQYDYENKILRIIMTHLLNNLSGTIKLWEKLFDLVSLNHLIHTLWLVEQCVGYAKIRYLMRENCIKWRKHILRAFSLCLYAVKCLPIIRPQSFIILLHFHDDRVTPMWTLKELYNDTDPFKGILKGNENQTLVRHIRLRSIWGEVMIQEWNVEGSR